MDITAIIQSLVEKFPGVIIDQSADRVTLTKEAVLPVFEFLKNGPAACVSLHGVTAVDRKETVEVVYHVHSFQHRVMLTVKVILPNDNLNVPSLTSLWGAADWMEREVFDLFGVRFEGHPDMRRILNPENWTGHPSRKDFQMDGVVPRPVK